MTEKITPRQQEILDKIVSIATGFNVIVQNDQISSDMRMGAHLAWDLGLDSIKQVEFIMKIEQEFNLNVSEDTWKSIQTLGDIVRLIEKMSAEPATKAADKTIAPKVVAKKASDKENMVTLTNVPGTAETPTKLNCGKITEEQKQNFLASITQFDPESINSANLCGFNLYYDHFYVWVTPFNIKRNYKSKNRRNVDKEMIIQIMPERPPECGASIKGECPKYLADGRCKSPLVKQTVGALLFPDKYGKER